MATALASAPTTQPRPAKTGRKLPSGKHQVVPGIGTFLLQSVGNTAWTKGVYVYFHAQGEDEARKGFLAFALKLGDDNHTRWIAHGPFYGPDQWDRRRDFGGADFGRVANAAARALVEKMLDDDEIGFLFQLLGAAGMKAERLKRQKQDATNSVETFSGCLSDPLAPRDFTNRRGEAITHSAEERADRRAYWQRGLEKAKAAVADFEANHQSALDGARIACGAVGDWTGGFHDRKNKRGDTFRSHLAAYGIEHVAS